MQSIGQMDDTSRMLQYQCRCYDMMAAHEDTLMRYLYCCLFSLLLYWQKHYCIPLQVDVRFAGRSRTSPTEQHIQREDLWSAIAMPQSSLYLINDVLKGDIYCYCMASMCANVRHIYKTNVSKTLISPCLS